MSDDTALIDAPDAAAPESAPPSKPPNLKAAVAFAADRFGVDPGVLAGMLMKESALRPDVISGETKSRAGAIGVMQFMPATAERYGIDPTDPVQSIIGAAAYLRDNLQKFDGDYGKAIAGYNWGENREAFNSPDWQAKLPAETRDYVDFVSQFAKAMGSKANVRPMPTIGAGRGLLSNTEGGFPSGTDRPKPQQEAAPANGATPVSFDEAGNTTREMPTLDAGAGRGFVNDTLTPAQKAIDAETPSQTAARVATNAGKSVMSGFAKAGQASALVTGGAATIADKVHSLISGKTETGAQDWAFSAADKAKDAQTWWSPTPEEAPTIAEHIVNALAGSAPDLMMAAATGAAGEVPAVGQATVTGLKAATEAVLHGMRNMSLPAFNSGITTAAEELRNGASLDQAVKLGLTNAAVTDVTGGLPMAKTGAALPARMATGAVIGGAGADVQRQLENLARPDDRQVPFDPESIVVGAAQGAAFGALPHPAARTPDRIDLGYEPTRTPIADAAAEAARPDPIHAILSAGSVDEATHAAAEAIKTPPCRSVTDQLLALRPLGNDLDGSMQQALRDAGLGSKRSDAGAMPDAASDQLGNSEVAPPIDATRSPSEPAPIIPDRPAEVGADRAVANELASVVPRDESPTPTSSAAVPVDLGLRETSARPSERERIEAMRQPTLAERVEAMRARPPEEPLAVEPRAESLPIAERKPEASRVVEAEPVAAKPAPGPVASTEGTIPAVKPPRPEEQPGLRERTSTLDGVRQALDNSSLTVALKRAGDALYPADKRAILASARELKRGGLANREAALRAVDAQRLVLRELTEKSPGAVDSTSRVQPVAVEQPAGTAPPRIDDVGEKIGGARKDTSTRTGPRPMRAEESTVPGWQKRYEVSQIAKSSKPNEEGRWALHDSRKKDYLGQPKQIGSTFATEADARAAIPLAEVSRNHRAVPRSGNPGEPSHYEIVRDVSDRKRVVVVPDKFATRDEAMRYMAEHAARIIETKTSFGEEILPRPDRVQRTGPERRVGDVKGEDLKSAFGLRGVEFGNWNAQDERQTVMNHAYDALMDLAEVLHVPPKAIGLNGQLALAFGARGQGLQGARAHYELDYGVINLTKISGAGSLAHEWFHALDHYLGMQDGKTSSTRIANERGDMVYPVKSAESGMASHGFQGKGSGVREELRSAYGDLIRTMSKKAEKYVEDVQRVDKFTGQAREELASKLDALRNDLSEQKDERYWKRNNKPASAEQLAAFDAIAEKMVAGELLSTDWRAIEGNKSTRSYLSSSRWTNDSLEQLSAIYKAVRGRSGFDSTNQSGVLDTLRGAMTRYSERLKMLSEAQRSDEKTRMVPTDFAMEAKSIDQGRASDYWTTEHEMAARAFQAYVEDKVAARGGQSDFLTYGTNTAVLTPWGWKRPFPQGKEREAIDAAFDKFVGEIKTREDEAGNVAMFKRGTATDDARVARVQSIVDGIKSTWKNAPDIVLAKNMQDEAIPAAVRAEDQKQRSQGATGDPAAFVHGGTVYLLTDQLHSPQEVATALLHESLGHLGLKGTFGKGLDVVLDRVALLNSDQVRAKAKEYGLDFSKPDERRAAAEEVLAELAAEHPEASVVRSAIAAIRSWLRENMPGLSKLELSDDEILRQYLLPARNFVKGERPAVDTASSDAAAVRFSRKQSTERSIDASESEDERAVRAVVNKPGSSYLEAAKAMRDDLFLKISPMSLGSDVARNEVKGYLNKQRAADYQWIRTDDLLKENFTERQLEAMWNAADDQNLILSRGAAPARTEGINVLPDDQRSVVQTLHAYGEQLMERARSAGMYEGQGVPYWAPRMAAMIGADGEVSLPKAGGAPTDPGGNFTTRASSLNERKYLTAEETEAAMKAKFGEGATLVRNIRTMPLQMARLERAIAARELINGIQELGQRTGTQTTSSGAADGFFTIDHPAFQTYRPRLERGDDGKHGALLDADGNVVLDRVPIYVSKEFQGPLKAAMSEKSGQAYVGLITLKAKSMSVVMYSPLIHNAVEYGRAFPVMPGKMLTLSAYRDGAVVKRDPALMREAIERDGVVPIGRRAGMQDLTGILEEPTLTAGRSLTAKALAAPVGIVSKQGALAVKKGVDAVGDFWHNTLLWNRVGDLQMGLWKNAKDHYLDVFQRKGLDPDQAKRLAGLAAGHWANRYAGALPNEAMSSLARKFFNLVLFSRSFTLGNLGAMKDMFTGFPADVRSQMLMSAGEAGLKTGVSVGRRKAIAAFVLDLGLMYTVNSTIQSFIDYLKRDKDSGALDFLADMRTPDRWRNLPKDLRIGKLEQEYIDRFRAFATKAKEHPLDIVAHPWDSLESLTSNSENEPRKGDRIYYGKQEDGTAIYARSPFGKVGEDFKKWMTNPMRTAYDKSSQFVKPLVDIGAQGLGNPIDGRQIWTPSDGAAAVIGKSIVHIAKAQIPMDAVTGAWDWYNDNANEVDKLKVVGPLAGVTFSKGAPGGPAVGAIYDEQRRQDAEVHAAMPEIQRALKLANMTSKVEVQNEYFDKAMTRMQELKMSPGQMRSIIEHALNPESRLSKSAMKRFAQTADDEAKAKIGQLMDR